MNFFQLLKGKLLKFSAFITKRKEQLAKLKFLHHQRKTEVSLIKHLSPRRLPSFSQLKHLKKVLSPKEKIIFNSSLALLIIAIIGMVTFNLFRSGEQVAADGGLFTEAVIGRPLYINPLYAVSNDVDSDLSRLVYSGLVRLDKNYQIVPDLASKWTVSDDKKEYIFTIRNDAQWHDGEKVTANDVLFTIEAIQNKDYKSPLLKTFSGIKAETIDENRIKLTLSEPYSSFLYTMTVGILPQHLWFDIPSTSAQLAGFNLKPIGSGPYKFDHFTKDKNGQIISYTFAVNKKFYLGRAHIDQLEFRFFGEPTSAIEAVLNHQVDSINYVPKEELEKVFKRSINIFTVPLAQYSALYLNDAKSEVLKSTKVRQALNLALDKDSILRMAINSQGRVINTTLPLDSAVETSVEPFQTNQDEALNLITSDGWKLNEANEWTKGGQTLKVKITTSDQNDYIKAINLIKEQWEALHIGVEVVIEARQNLVKNIIPQRDYEILLYGVSAGYDWDLYYFWHSSQRDFPGLNLGNYSNRKVDTALEEVRQIEDPAKKEEKLIEIAKTINTDQPAIFLYSPFYLYPVNNTVKGISIPKMNRSSDRFWNIMDWYVKTKRK